MNKAFINTDVWKDGELYDLPIESKVLYFFLISGPERQYINVFKFNRKYIAMIMGVTDQQFQVALKYLAEAGFVEVYNDYIGILKSHAVELGGVYNKINSEREYNKLPEDIRNHFYPSGRAVEQKTKPTKKAKRGPQPESIADIIAKQPEALRQPLQDFVDDRKERKRPATTRAVKGWINKLETMYPNDINKRIRSIEQSIERGWNGLFEVKENFADKEKERKFM